ncbi:hypothetical protein ARMGADRAFT_778479 [Armillaria gallica]|uniref:Uncharacterized protein n=1 Tax=Armillaria gallica TaxID=47427 RepID=A0A2H3CI10_ARMGA|nr:hypothetical protein ARMGADRAFT_778479 [Armillaria gallica]
MIGIFNEDFLPASRQRHLVEVIMITSGVPRWTVLGDPTLPILLAVLFLYHKTHAQILHRQLQPLLPRNVEYTSQSASRSQKPGGFIGQLAPWYRHVHGKGWKPRALTLNPRVLAVFVPQLDLQKHGAVRDKVNLRSSSPPYKTHLSFCTRSAISCFWFCTHVRRLLSVANHSKIT